MGFAGRIEISTNRRLSAPTMAGQVAIEAVLVNVAFNGERHQVTNGSSLADASLDFCRRNIQIERVQHANEKNRPREQAVQLIQVHLVAGTSNGDYVAQA
jgi:hypothetical protein